LYISHHYNPEIYTTDCLRAKQNSVSEDVHVIRLVSATLGNWLVFLFQVTELLLSFVCVIK